MPRKTLENPFKPKKLLRDDDIELVRGVLGDKEADEMASLTGDQKTKPVEEPEQKPLGDFDLSVKETKEVEKEQPWSRKKVIAWAKSFGVGKNWVDFCFHFEKDGSIIITKSIKLIGKGITDFPKGVKEVRGDLDLRSNQITSLEGLPDSIGGSLYLARNQITSLEGLPGSIGGDLYLQSNPLFSLEGMSKVIGGSLQIYNIPANSIPENLNIGGKVLINKDNQALIKDAQEKGYEVQII